MAILADILIPPQQQFGLAESGPLRVVHLLVSLGTIGCFLFVLVSLFRAKGVLHGILGILSCGLYPFIWGWMAPKELGTRRIMPIWLALGLIGVAIALFGPKPPGPHRPIHYPPFPTPAGF